MDDKPYILVEVAYASANEQIVQSIKIPANSTVEHAINESGILQQCTEIDLSKFAVGVFGEVVSNAQILKDQDRVEIYRPLTIDPMRARRKRAELQS